MGHLVVKGLRITRARQLDPTTGTMADGPVQLQANIPGRSLVLRIIANMVQQDVLRIAHGILQAATYASARQAHGSYLPAHGTRVRITYRLPLVPHGAIATQRTMRLTITRQSDIAALVRVVDALPLSARTPGSPPPTGDVSTGQHVTAWRLQQRQGGLQ